MRFDRTTFDPQIMGGRACIRGMRITAAKHLNFTPRGEMLRCAQNDRTGRLWVFDRY